MQASPPTLCRGKERLLAANRQKENLVEQAGIHPSAVGRDHIRPRPNFPGHGSRMDAASARRRGWDVAPLSLSNYQFVAGGSERKKPRDERRARGILRGSTIGRRHIRIIACFYPRAT
jgi:hypothetical protein